MTRLHPQRRQGARVLVQQAQAGQQVLEHMQARPAPLLGVFRALRLENGWRCLRLHLEGRQGARALVRQA